ncbi:cupin domain-containing protein [Nitrogeniibacter aestuarii]|uniref:cupin domain-containing protein n=1 Tax=Nitrogeniibacter aestuarii TaxID=2815343 RepID=UPI001D10F555|nr:cupin domain-containing protein [Nitrogeniibacter aestuarii]
MTDSNIRRAREGFLWEGVEVLAYKDKGSAPFRDVTRQLLFRTDDLGCELRYFEVSADGHSTLERHEHAHAVMILRGRGVCLVGTELRSVGAHDLVSIPAWTWHQFRASAGEPLGFLCMVNVARDRPQLPGEADLAQLRADPKVAAFIRT